MYTKAKFLLPLPQTNFGRGRLRLGRTRVDPALRPACAAFAEDVVLGRASLDDCIFRVRERMRDVAGPGGTDVYLPPPFRQKKAETE